jgi:prepilin-type N-terminal cleavage/methylation domain-containing protein
MTRKSGFTILELLVVVVVLGVILAFAIPQFLAARKTANETSAIGSLRRLTAFNEQYRLRFASYAGGLSMLQAAGFNTVVEDTEKSGYSFRYKGDVRSWTCFAVPQSPESGDRGFYLDQTGLIRAAESDRIGPGSPPID